MSPTRNPATSASPSGRPVLYHPSPHGVSGRHQPSPGHRHPKQRLGPYPSRVNEGPPAPRLFCKIAGHLENLSRRQLPGLGGVNHHHRTQPFSPGLVAPQPICQWPGQKPLPVPGAPEIGAGHRPESHWNFHNPCRQHFSLPMCRSPALPSAGHHPSRHYHHQPRPLHHHHHRPHHNGCP